MNSALLLIPFFLIRFTLLSHLNRGTIKRAAHFPPMAGIEIPAYWIYQLSNAALILYLFFLTVKTSSWQFYAGAALYLTGLALCAVTIANFSAPSEDGMNRNGLYKISRNPMYVSYFILFTGCAFLTRSLSLFGIIVLFQISAHWIILSEERWCLETFGASYKQYMETVRRYL